MPNASLKFTQGSPGPGAGGNGYAVIGVAGTLVTAANVDNTGVYNAQFELLYVPPGTALTTGVKQAYAVDGPPPTLDTDWTFTPDVAGCYAVRIRVKDSQGNESVDDRVFAVLEASGRLIPGPVGGRAMNFLGQLLGWLPYVREYFLALDALELRTAREATLATTDNAAHTLMSLALPTSAIVLVTCKVLAIKADGSAAKWWKVERGYHHNGSTYAAGTRRDTDSEAITGSPSWTIDLDLNAGAARVQVNSANDSVKWYVSRAHVTRLTT